MALQSLFQTQAVTNPQWIKLFPVDVCSASLKIKIIINNSLAACYFSKIIFDSTKYILNEDAYTALGYVKAWEKLINLELLVLRQEIKMLCLKLSWRSEAVASASDFWVLHMLTKSFLQKHLCYPGLSIGCLIQTWHGLIFRRRTH